MFLFLTYDYSKYEDKLRDDKIQELKLMLNKQQTLFYKVNKESEAAVGASYVIAEEIAKKKNRSLMENL
jgi:hypothetical protein